MQQPEENLPELRTDEKHLLEKGREHFEARRAFVVSAPKDHKHIPALRRLGELICGGSGSDVLLRSVIDPFRIGDTLMLWALAKEKHQYAVEFHEGSEGVVIRFSPR
ncbi:MAG: hypothetical protein AB7S74_18230 [Hyphomicrobium sp.]